MENNCPISYMHCIKLKESQSHHYPFILDHFSFDSYVKIYLFNRFGLKKNSLHVAAFL